MNNLTTERGGQAVMNNLGKEGQDMFKVVAINDSYSLCVSAGNKDVKVEDKLLILGTLDKDLVFKNERLGKHYYIKAQVVIKAVFERYCICESDVETKLYKMPLLIDPNQLSGILKEIFIGDIALSQTN